MNNKRVPYISHKEHDHPDTKAAKAKCRMETLALAEVAEKSSRIMQDSPPPASGDEVAELAAYMKSKSGKSASKASIKKVSLPIEDLRYLIESLDYITQQTADFAEVNGIDVTVEVRKIKYSAVYSRGTWSIEFTG